MQNASSLFRFTYTSGLFFGLSCFFAFSWYQVYQKQRQESQAYAATLEHVGVTLQKTTEQLNETVDLDHRRIEDYLVDGAKQKYRSVGTLLREFRRKIHYAKKQVCLPKPEKYSLEAWVRNREKLVDDLERELHAMYSSMLIVEAITLGLSETIIRSQIAANEPEVLSIPNTSTQYSEGYTLFEKRLCAKLAVLEHSMTGKMRSLIGGRSFCFFGSFLSSYLVKSGNSVSDSFELFLFIQGVGGNYEKSRPVVTINGRKQPVDVNGVVRYKLKYRPGQKLDIKVRMFNKLTGEVFSENRDLTYLFKKDSL